MATGQSRPGGGTFCGCRWGERPREPALARHSEDPVFRGKDVWFRGTYHGKDARLRYSLDGEHYTDTGRAAELKFGKWKGARPALFCFGPNGGAVDVDFVKYNLEK
jgi:hypothetical protein